jgi:Fur family ferric uptake transcriptional regulator
MMLSTADARALLKAHGLRSTTPRLAVLQALAAQPGPISHSQLLGRMPAGRFDSATVYRNLMRLAERGILSVVSRAGGMARYALTTDSDHPHRHAHFVCTDCDTVSCLPEDALPVPPVAGPWSAAVAAATLQLQGRCPDCLSAAL